MKINLSSFLKELLYVLLIGIAIVIGFNVLFFSVDWIASFKVNNWILISLVVILIILIRPYKILSSLSTLGEHKMNTPRKGEDDVRYDLPERAEIIEKYKEALEDVEKYSAEEREIFKKLIEEIKDGKNIELRQYELSRERAALRSPRYYLLDPILLLMSILILLGLLLVYIYRGKIGGFLISNHLLLSYGLMIFLFQFTLRKSILKKQTWKKISTIWLKWTGISSISIGGFGFIALNDTIKSDLLNIITDSSFVNIELMTTIYIITITLLLAAGITSLIGRASCDDEETNIPMAWFIPTFVFSWLAITSACSLVSSSLILTSYAHLGN